MSEVVIPRFRGMGADLPDTRLSEWAVDTLNVYEDLPGQLSRREGTRRAIEYHAPQAVRNLAIFVQPGGEYTGLGLDVLLQADELVGKSAPRPIAQSYYYPEITNITSRETDYTCETVYVRGKNFDSWPDRKIQVYSRVYGTPTWVAAASIEYGDPSFLIAVLGLPVSSVGIYEFKVVNPNGVESAPFQRRWQGGLLGYHWRPA